MSKILFTDARFYSPGNVYNAMLCEDGIITELFEAIPNPSPDWQIESLGNCWVYPGFTDTHTHSFEGGLYSNGLDLSGVASIAELQERVRLHCISRDKGELIFAWRFDELKTHEGRFPTRFELDRVSPHNPLVLRRIDGHSCMLNRLALAEIPLMNPASELLRGADNDQAVHHFHANVREDQILRAYHSAAEIALKGGFSSIHTMIGDAQYSNTHYRLIRDKLSDFKVRYSIYPQSFNLDDALALGAERIGGCILADGSFGSHTAALTEPYLGTNELGKLYQSNGFWDSFVAKAHERDLQVAVHCIGDRAIAQINQAYLKARKASDKDLRHQLIHCELVSDELLEQIVLSGAAAVVQPAFDHYWGARGGFYEKALGEERWRLLNRFKSLSESGVRLCFGSDWYITELDALKGIHAAINHHNPEERINIDEAIAAYTQNAAWLSHEEEIKGSLSIGKVVDLTVLNKELTEDFQLSELEVARVYKAGVLQYAKP